MAPCSLDVARCAASILLAAEQWRMTPTAATGMVLTYLDSYRAATADPKPGEVAPSSGHGAIWDLLSVTAAGTQVALLDHVTRRKRSGRRAIRAGWNHPKLGPDRTKVVRGAIDTYLEDHAEGKGHPPRVLDLTGRIAGVGSLGVRRYLALVGDGKHDDADRVLDVKECGASAILPCATGPQPLLRERRPPGHRGPAADPGGFGRRAGHADDRPPLVPGPRDDPRREPREPRPPAAPARPAP